MTPTDMAKYLASVNGSKYGEKNAAPLAQSSPAPAGSSPQAASAPPTVPVPAAPATSAASSPSSRVYLDHAATSPLRPEVFEAMRPWLAGGFGNASTLYLEGKRARQALDEARAAIAGRVGANPTEIVFTSGGTESNNALIAGITTAVRTKKGMRTGGNHVVTSAFEHHAVLQPMHALKRDGYEVTLVEPARDGFMQPEPFAAALRPSTVLASVMLAQNEIGTLQPIAALAASAHENNTPFGANGTFFHTDAVQALGKCALDMEALGVDAATFSAHKIGGPSGVGAFFLKRQTPFVATQLGGGQEGGRRSGTPNVAGAVGFAKALELAEAERAQESVRLVALRDFLATSLLSLDERITLTVPLEPGQTEADGHLPGMLSFLVGGYESETLILRLDNAGFAVSGGSACSTGSLDPSHVLISLGLSRNEAYSALRISLGRENTLPQLETFLATLAKIIH